MTIVGYAGEIEKAVCEVLKGRLPVGATLEFSEHEDWRSAGTMMDDHNEYFGVLTIVVRQNGDAGRELARINSRGTSRTGSGQYVCDRNNYDYSITEEKILSWFPRE